MIMVVMLTYIIFALVGCNRTSDNFIYPELLAKEGTFFILAVDKFEQDSENPTVFTGNKELVEASTKARDLLPFKRGEKAQLIIPDLEDAQERYPELNIETAPAILLFNNEGIVFKTYDMKETKKYFEQKAQEIKNK
jgi:hypothetical protein